MSVGTAAQPDSQRSGQRAALQAVTGAQVRLLMVFCAGRHDPSAVLAGIGRVAPGIPLIGCSSRTVIGAGGARDDAVIVVALGGPGFAARTAVGYSATAAQREAGAQAAACASVAADDRHRILILLTDGLAPHQEEIIAGAYGVVGASVPLVGGSATPDRLSGGTFQLCDDKAYTDAVVGAEIISDGPFGIGLGHGWHTVGDRLIVTDANYGVVRTLDDQPAVAAYLSRFGAPEQLHTDPAAFHRFARTRPIGLPRRDGIEVRNVSSTEYLGQGWLSSSGEIPDSALVWLMEGDEDSALEAATGACRTAVKALHGASAIGLIAFDCISRADLFGPAGMFRELDAMRVAAAPAPVAGLYTWGEIARTRGIHGFHNQTVVVLAVA